MSAITVLAAAFAGIVGVGCGLVYLHDVVERLRGRDAGKVGGNEGGFGLQAPVWRSRRLSGPQAPSGKIVWVRAGNNRVHEPGGSGAAAGPSANRR